MQMSTGDCWHWHLVISYLQVGREERAKRHRRRTGVSEGTVLCLALNEFAIICGTIVFWLPSELHHVTCLRHVPHHSFGTFSSSPFQFPCPHTH